MAAYRGLKRRMFENMNEEDLAIVPHAELQDLPGRARRVSFGATEGDCRVRRDSVRCDQEGNEDICTEGTSFEGEDFGATVACAVILCRELGLPVQVLKDVLRTFDSLPHRMERVCEVDGVEFLNDSKATNLSAMMAAVGAQERPIRLIAGGRLKENGLQRAKEVLANKVAGVYLIGESMLAFKDAWEDAMPCHECGALEEAVRTAWEDANPGDAVLLSPACASFDQFSGFEERGESFKRIAELISRET